MYIIRVLIAIDQLLNTILMGYPDETLSARSYRSRNKSIGWKYTNFIINNLFFFQPHHTKSAFKSEQKHDDSPVGEK